MAKIGLIGIAAVFLSMLFKKEKPELAVLTGIAASVIIFSYALARFSVVIAFLEEVWKKLPVEQTFFVQLLKMLGITYVADFSAGICKDSGHEALGGQIELFAKLSILALSIPGLFYLSDVLERFL